MELSVIVAVCDGETYISECLSSILNQTYRDYEVIIVDDGSSDRTGVICRTIADGDNRVKVIQQENEGPCRARLRGVEEAVGEYVLLCDADDCYATPIAFDSLVSYLRKYNTLDNPIDLLQFGHIKKYRWLNRKVNHGSKICDLSEEEFIDTQYPAYLSSDFEEAKVTMTVWDKLYSRDLFSRLEDFEVPRIFTGEDQVLHIHLLENCRRVLVIPDLLYTYRVLSGGTTRFRMNEMNDMAIIKTHQAAALEKYSERKWFVAVQKKMYLEAASWLLVWAGKYPIEQEEDYADFEKRVAELLDFPALKEASSYLQQVTENWDAIRLLVERDASAYVDFKKNKQQPRPGMKEMCRSWIRKLI